MCSSLKPLNRLLTGVFKCHLRHIILCFGTPLWYTDILLCTSNPQIKTQTCFVSCLSCFVSKCFLITSCGCFIFEDRVWWCLLAGCYSEAEGYSLHCCYHQLIQLKDQNNLLLCRSILSDIKLVTLASTD